MSASLPPLTEQAIESMRRMGVDVDLLFGRRPPINGNGNGHPQSQQQQQQQQSFRPSGLQGYTPTFGGISGYDPGPSPISGGSLNGAGLGMSPNGYPSRQDHSHAQYTYNTVDQTYDYPSVSVNGSIGSGIGSPYTPTASVSPRAVMYQPPSSTGSLQGYQPFHTALSPTHTQVQGQTQAQAPYQAYQSASHSSLAGMDQPIKSEATFYPELINTSGSGNGMMNNTSSTTSRQPPSASQTQAQARVAPSKRESEDVKSNAGARPYPASYSTGAGPAGASGGAINAGTAGAGKKSTSKKDKEKDKENGGDGVDGEGGGKGGLGPVKNACLSCRAKKARCDGTQPICGQCISKDRECVYVKSKRGGARKRREKPPPEAPTALANFLQQLDHVMMLQPPPKTVGLDGLSMKNDVGSGGKSDFDHVRAVQKLDEDDVMGILRFYWSELHILLPLLPPIKHIKFISSRLKSDSPLLLAIRCIVALIPTPDDPDSKSLAAKALRRNAASELAERTGKRVQDIINIARQTGTKPPIECAQALSILGLYEFGQTNDAGKNWERLSQAADLAIELGLHQLDNATPFVKAEIPPYKDIAVEDHGEIMREMGRRTFWVVYGSMMLASMLAIKTPPLRARDKRITSSLPACHLRNHAWFNWVEGLCLNMDTVGVILTLDYGMPFDDTDSGFKDAYDADFELESIGYTEEQRATAALKRNLNRKLVETDAKVLLALQDAEESEITPLTSDPEEEMSRNHQLVRSMLLAACQVQIHRRQAFPEVALFGREMCGLPQPSDPPMSRLGESQSPRSVITSIDYTSSSRRGGSSSSGDYESSPPAQGSVGGYDPAGVQTSINGYNPMGANTNGGPSGALPISSNEYAVSDLPADLVPTLPMDGLLWNQSIFPETFPTPWFANPQGAGAFYQPLMQAPAYLPPVNGLYSADSGWLGAPLHAGSVNGWAPAQMGLAPSAFDMAHSQGNNENNQLMPSIVNSQLGYQIAPPMSEHQLTNNAIDWSADALASYRLPPAEPLTPWGTDLRNFQSGSISPPNIEYSNNNNGNENGNGVDVGDDGVENAVPVSILPDGPFPPGLSLQRCATAAHSIVRLQVLHRSAKLTMTQYPRLVPWCSCALVSGAYSFLLLCLAIQASNTFDAGDPASQQEIQAMWNNVQVILAGLEAYGQVWDGIDMMAAEVKAALEAAKQLPQDMAMSVRSGSTAR